MNGLPCDSEFPGHALLLGQRFRCVDANFKSDASAYYPLLPIEGGSYTLVEVHWGRCPDGRHRLAGNFGGLEPSRRGAGLFLRRFEPEHTPMPYPTDQALGSGCYIHTCALGCYHAIPEDDALVGTVLHPGLHEPVRLFVGHTFAIVSQAPTAIS